MENKPDTSYRKVFNRQPPSILPSVPAKQVLAKVKCPYCDLDFETAVSTTGSDSNDAACSHCGEMCRVVFGFGGDQGAIAFKQVARLEKENTFPKVVKLKQPEPRIAPRAELLLGCGARKNKDMAYDLKFKEWNGLVTLDHNSDHKPDVLWNLEKRPLPFKDNQFDEVHAYEVLEHIGKQGDYKGFFEEFTEYHRILKPNGLFFAHMPVWNCEWAWGDPSHTRIITPGTLTFLSQASYAEIGKTVRTDFREIYKADFKIEICQTREETMYFVLQAIK